MSVGVADRLSSGVANREDWLDAARGALMILGVFLHSAAIFQTSGNWVVADPDRSVFFDWFSQFIHVFRMPTFFWISGYFFAMTAGKTGSSNALKKRLPRIAIPLVVSWVTFNVAQVVLSGALSGQSVTEALRNGVPAFHLWFLVDLLVFCAIGAVLMPTLSGPTMRRVAQLCRSPGCQIATLSIGSFLLMILVHESGSAYTQFWGEVTLYGLATYFPFFMVGAWMFQNDEVRLRFVAKPAVLFPLGVIGACVCEAQCASSHGVYCGLLTLLKIGFIWLAVGSLLGLFQRLFNRESKFAAFLSDASYSIFLSHHLLVVALGFLLLSVPIPAVIKFLVISFSTITLAALWHVRIVKPNPALRLLFNGK